MTEYRTRRKIMASDLPSLCLTPALAPEAILSSNGRVRPGCGDRILDIGKADPIHRMISIW